ncbi:MAG: hypothetical protein IPN34_16230 [Planctomycetes bacterium]|nr:hypothetical protein [Planctomycetota bacterium]
MLRSPHLARLLFAALALALSSASLDAAPQGPPRVLGWNDLGMHCMDGDTSVFSILPPYNNLHAHLIVGGRLVSTGAGSSFRLSYEAVADPRGSINRTSIGKTDFWDHVQALFGVSLPPDRGLAGFSMPGAANVPQAMSFRAGSSEYVAEGIPITPLDDLLQKNPYPLMRLVARDGQGTFLADTTPTVPVSTEMQCVMCHASGSNPEARPSSGWVYAMGMRDDRLNILRLHDDRHRGTPLYQQALAAAGYSPMGLYATATNMSTPILCARCHGSNALPGTGVAGVSPLTAAMHGGHADARLADGRRLDDISDRSACYSCHPGSDTKCLRGAMGKAIGADGDYAMSCQSCHGAMSAVGAAGRNGWLEEPNCQSCHTGDVLSNAGALRFTDVFDTPGHMRTTPNPRFATNPDVPLPGTSLYRFSAGHGGLQCSACHGPTHAIYPTSEENDNLQSLRLQGHVGTIVECSTCHTNLGETQINGPHGLHPVGADWVDRHGDVAERLGTSGCSACHGATFRGTLLSRASMDRTLSTRYGARTFWRGFEVGCYECHNGPTSDDPTTNTPPQVAARSASTPTDREALLVLSGTDANNDPLILRIVEQPAHGTVAFDGTRARYRAFAGYVGPDSYSYAANDGRSDSNLGVVSLTVQAAACPGGAESFGFGCALPDGSVPSLSLVGCPRPGERIELRATGIAASSVAAFAFGMQGMSIELGVDGCALRTFPLWVLSPPVAVVGGTASLALDLPNELLAGDLAVQAFCASAAAPRGFTATPGLAVRVRR